MPFSLWIDKRLRANAENILQNLKEYFPGQKWHKNDLRNRNARIFGFNTEDIENKSKQQYFVDSIAEHLATAEYPDESLIVMRRKLCWEISDILYLPLNARVYEAKKKLFHHTLSDKLSNWSRVDTILHSTFNRTLWK